MHTCRPDCHSALLRALRGDAQPELLRGVKKGKDQSRSGELIARLAMRKPAPAPRGVNVFMCGRTDAWVG